MLAVGSVVLFASSVSATYYQTIDAYCDLASAAPGSDASCSASVEYIDNFHGVTEEIESTVTFNFVGGECWNPRISFEYRENDFDGTDEYIELFQQGSSGHVIADGWIGGTSHAADTFDECKPDDATLSLTANGYSGGASNGYKIGVQCCDYAGTSGSRPGCVMGVTFAEAEQVCEDAGMRLCTIVEVKDLVGRGTGCQFDHGSVWTSTECLVNRYSAKSEKLNVLGSANSEAGAGMVVSVDLSSRWVIGFMLILATLLAISLWRMARSASFIPKRKYNKIAYATPKSSRSTRPKRST